MKRFILWFFFFAILVVGVIIGIVFLGWPFTILGTCFVIWSLTGFRSVSQQERWVIEIFGRYLWTLKPGLKWILPGVMRIRARVDIREQTIPLFETPIKIDFRDGSVIPKGAEVFVRVVKPDTPYLKGKDKGKYTGVYRTVYMVRDWRIATRELIENAARTGLNHYTIDEGIIEGKAGYDLSTPDPDSGLPNHELKRIREVLEGWGLELCRITIQDFDLPPDLVKARGEVQISKRKAEAADFVVKRQAKEWVGMVLEAMAQSRGKSVGEIQKEINAVPELKREFLNYTKMINLRLEEADRDALIHAVVDSGEKSNGSEGSKGDGFLDKVAEMFIKVLLTREKIIRKEKKEPSKPEKEETEEDEEKEMGEIDKKMEKEIAEMEKEA